MAALVSGMFWLYFLWEEVETCRSVPSVKVGFALSNIQPGHGCVKTSSNIGQRHLSLERCCLWMLVV